MTDRPGSRSRAVLVVGMSAAFAVLAHLAIAEGLSPRLGAALSLVPLAAMLLWAVRRTGRPAAGFAAALLGLLAAWLAWEHLQAHFSDLFFVEHAGVNLALAFLFGRTLAPGCEPLCTRFARIVHEGLPPDVAEYTRGVTLAWTVFFTAMFAVSCVLYLGGFVAAWSFFANIVNPLLVVGLFLVEYAVRVRALPDVERVGILGGVRAFSRHMGATRFEPHR